MMSGHKQAFKAVRRAGQEPRNLVVFAVSFVLVVLLLQWLFQPSTFWFIVSNQSLTLLDKVDVIVDGFFYVFEFIDDFTPIAFVTIAFFQSLAITLLLDMKLMAVRASQRKNLYGLSLGLFGAGCVACSGSLFTPILGLFASEAAVGAASIIGNFVLLAAIGFSYRSWYEIALQYSKYIGSNPGRKP